MSDSAKLQLDLYSKNAFQSDSSPLTYLREYDGPLLNLASKVSQKTNQIFISELTASLSSLNNIAWLRLNDTEVRMTVIPERGTQVWAVLATETLFQTYTVQSAASLNAINLEVPLPPLLRALRPISQSSPHSSADASIRLTKKDGAPSLCVTLLVRSYARPGALASADDDSAAFDAALAAGGGADGRERETRVTLDVPVRVLPPERVRGLHEPTCREPDVHILLPPLGQLKAISDRFGKLALASSSSGNTTTTASTHTSTQHASSSSSQHARLTLSATMHGHLRLSLKTAHIAIASTWRGLLNPALDPAETEGGEEGVANARSTRMRAVVPVVETDASGDFSGSEEEDDDEVEDDVEGRDGALRKGWAHVRLDARDWSRVLSVGRLGGKVVACFCHGFALVLYVYLGEDVGGGGGGGGVGGNGGAEGVLTYYISSYSA